MDRKAFLLFEVTLTVAILSIGLVFVVRSIGLSMKVARTASNYNQAINLAYEKMFDLEVGLQLGGLSDSTASGAFPDKDDFSWEYSVQQLATEGLGELVLDISWKEGPRESGFDIVTYVKTEQ